MWQVFDKGQLLWILAYHVMYQYRRAEAPKKEHILNLMSKSMNSLLCAVLRWGWFYLPCAWLCHQVTMCAPLPHLHCIMDLLSISMSDIHLHNIIEDCGVREVSDSICKETTVLYRECWVMFQFGDVFYIHL